MAAAFAALVSLQNNMRLIYSHPNHTFPFEKEQILSLRGSVRFLIDFMTSYDNSHGVRRETAETLEIRIARAAQVAEDVIESHMVDQIRCGKTRPSRFLLDLQKVAIEMDYMKRKASTVRARSGMLDPPTHSPSSSSSAQSTPLLTSSMVGFDDILLKLLDLLTGVPLSRRVIPIQGMGGMGAITRERRVVISGEVNHETITSDAPVRFLIGNGLKLLRTLSKFQITSIHLLLASQGYLSHSEAILRLPWSMDEYQRTMMSVNQVAAHEGVTVEISARLSSYMLRVTDQELPKLRFRNTKETAMEQAQTETALQSQEIIWWEEIIVALPAVQVPVGYSYYPTLPPSHDSPQDDVLSGFKTRRCDDTDQDENEEVCCICLDDLHRGSVTTLDCRHEFHADCIRRWLVCGESFCPLCKAPAIK
ncbi:putative late blight resistance protein R1B-17 [Salvia divinorum]|uniref:RING-type E3 ubiquitin transferase n=1 Tax=Salvia divinorum TaxID=28513 RepID=A0ABD1HJR8_SALDI